MLGGTWLAWLNRDTPGLPPPYGYRWAYAIVVLASSAVGLLLGLRVPRNVLGLLFLALSCFGAVDFALEGYASYAVLTREGELPGGAAAAWVFNWSWVPAVGLAGVYFPLLFPDGHVLSPGWRKVAYVGLPAILATIASLALRPGPLEEFPAVENPLGISWVPEFAPWFAIIVLFGCAILAAYSQFLRYRAAVEDERHQIRWVAAVAALVTATFVIAGLAEGPLNEWALQLQTAFMLSIALLPIATGIAVLRYRLYDIDILINRTIVYVPLTALLAGLYIAVIGILRSFLEGTIDASSDVSIALSTLLVVALVTPLKNQFQAVVDRRFKEAPDPARELNRLREQARAYVDVADMDRFLSRYLDELVRTFGARGGSIEVAHMDVDVARRTVGEPEPVALAVDLERQGEPLGTLALAARADARPYTAADSAAVQSYAQTAAQLIALASSGKPSAHV
jgi:hypothetical protein